MKIFDKAGKDSLAVIANRLRERRSTRLFLPKAVEPQLVTDAIELARWAPNHRLTEPWHFYVLGERTKEDAVELIRAVVSEAKGKEAGDFKAASASTVPGWLVVTCQRSRDSLREREDYASCSCAIQNLTLYLSEAGIASKWTTGPVTRDERFYDLLGADSDKEFIVGLIWFGYPKMVPQQSRKSVDEISTFLD